MNSFRQHISSLLKKVAFFAVLLAMLLQPAIHMLDFAMDSEFDGISMELLEDMGEKELEEEGEFEKVELRTASTDLNDYNVSTGPNFQNKIAIIWAFTPETHIPPPEYL